MADFSLALNEDQQQIKQWVHDFAATVVRPAAHEWPTSCGSSSARASPP